MYRDTAPEWPESVPVCQSIALEEEVEAAMEGRTAAGADREWQGARPTGSRERCPLRYNAQAGHPAN